MISGKPTYLNWGGPDSLQAKWREYEEGKTKDFPVILEPSAYKYKGPAYELLKPQWDIFLDRLCQADCVLIIGYSLPDGDLQALSKLLMGFQVNVKSRWAVVDPSDDVCKRYNQLIGRVRLQTFATTLSGFNSDLAENLQRAFQNVDFPEPPEEAVKAAPT